MSVANSRDDRDCEQQGIWKIPLYYMIIVNNILMRFKIPILFQPVFCPSFNFSIIVEVAGGLDKFKFDIFMYNHV